jgi:hypothetical protein
MVKVPEAGSLPTDCAACDVALNISYHFGMLTVQAGLRSVEEELAWMGRGRAAANFTRLHMTA